MSSLDEARLHARLPVYRRRIDQAQQIIKTALMQCDSPYVATSFGKDSATLMHLVMAYQPDIQCRFIRWPESNLLHDYERVIGEWRERGINLHILDLSRPSLSEPVADRWVQLRRLSPADAVFNGIRADESHARRVTLRTHGTIYRQKSGVLRICPLANWKTADVAAYCIQHDLPTLSDYHRYGYEARTTSRIPRETYGIREAVLQRLREDSLENYLLLQSIYPDVVNWR